MSAVLERTIPKTTARGVKTRLITVAEYDRMIEAGIYTENDRIELLNGEIIELMPKGTKHTSANSRIVRLFVRLFDEKVIVRSQDPIRLDDFSVVLRGQRPARSFPRARESLNLSRPKVKRATRSLACLNYYFGR